GVAAEPLLQRLERWQLFRKPDGATVQAVDFVAVKCCQQRIAVREMPVERADADPCPRGDCGQRQLVALGNDVGSRLQQLLPISRRIGAWPTGSICLAQNFLQPPLEKRSVLRI